MRYEYLPAAAATAAATAAAAAHNDEHADDVVKAHSYLPVPASSSTASMNALVDAVQRTAQKMMRTLG